MNHAIASPTLWSTASRSDAPVSTASDLSSLGEHLDACRRSQGRLFALQCAGGDVARQLSARRISVIVFLLVCGAGSLALR